MLTQTLPPSPPAGRPGLRLVLLCALLWLAGSAGACDTSSSGNPADDAPDAVDTVDSVDTADTVDVGSADGSADVSSDAGADIGPDIAGPQDAGDDDASVPADTEDTAFEDTAFEDTAFEDTAADTADPDPDTADSDTADPDTADPDTADPDTADPDTADAGEESDSDDAWTGSAPQGLGFLSTPVEAALVGQTFRYPVAIDVLGVPTLSLVQAPDGMKLVDGDTIEWVPAPGTSGPHLVTVRAEHGDAVGEQMFELLVSKPLPLAQSVLGPAGGSVASFGGATAGSSVDVPPGALTDLRLISLAELDLAVMPAALLGDAATTALALGPTGTSFAAPVQVKVPYDASLEGLEDQITVMTMQEQVGCWADMPVLGIDTENHLAIVEASHFSIIVAGLPSATAELDLADAGDVESCPRELVGRATMTTPLEEVPSTAVGLLTDPLAPDVAGLVTDPEFAGSLRAIWVVELLGPEQPPVGIEASSLAATLVAPGDGTGRLVVAGPSGGVRLEQEFQDLTASWADDIEPVLRGEGLRFRMKPSDAEALGLRARLHLRYEPGDAGALPYLPIEQGKLLLEETLAAAEPATLGASEDADCDGIADGIDPVVVAGAPLIEVKPEGPVKINAGVELDLSCVGTGPVGAGALTFDWSSEEATDQLTVSGATTTFVGTEPGERQVSCTSEWEGQPVAHVFSVYVKSEEDNAAPTCSVHADVKLLGAGKTTTLTANPGDPDDLYVEGISWGLMVDGEFVPSELLKPATGKTITFGPAPGGAAYDVACKAFDGLAFSEPSPTTIEVLTEGADEPPVGATLVPTGISVEVGEELVLTASAQDASDLEFTWGPAALLLAGEDTASSSQVTFIAQEPGLYGVQVAIDDGTNDPIVLDAKIYVVAVAGALDVDSDGFPADGDPPDCDDTDPTINPGAEDLCGNGLDDDCDGDIDEGSDGQGCPELAGDTDNDGVDDGADNCPFVANADQADADDDEIGDACDVECGDCDDGDGCTSDSCNAATGACKHVKVVCSDDDPCTVLACNPADGGCESSPNTGAACDDGDPCTDADACDVDGECFGALIDCDDQDACTEGESCNPETGDCDPGAAAVCDDGLLCTDDNCDPGSGCVFTPNQEPCDDGDVCTADDLCTGEGTCEGTPVVCDDADACNGLETCSPGVGCAPGSALECNDEEACTDDSCDAQTGCVFVPNTAPCDDGDTCTAPDACTDGECTGAPVVCNDENPCTADSCEAGSGCSFVSMEGASCDDGDLCTVNDICLLGVCEPGSPAFCNDDNPCTDDSCDPGAGCQANPNSNPCDDADECTESDACSEGSCSGVAIDCSDGDECTLDICEPATGCEYPPDPTCGCADAGVPLAYWKLDGDATSVSGEHDGEDLGGPQSYQVTETGQALIGGNPGFISVEGSPSLQPAELTVSVWVDWEEDGVIIGQGGEVVDAWRIYVEGEVLKAGATWDGTEKFATAGVTLGDGILHHVAMVFDGASIELFVDGVSEDSQAGATAPIDYGTGSLYFGDIAGLIDDVALFDTPLSGEVIASIHANGPGDLCLCGDDADCDDDSACTTDFCNQVSGCQNLSIECNDGNPCTADSCDPVSGCESTPAAAPCDDGDECTQFDSCDAGACTGVLKDCSDGDACTGDVCDVFGICSNPPLSCDDGSPCTSDSCNPGTGCQHTNTSGPCDDQDTCTLSDSCADGVCTGTPLSCDDGDPCTENECDPASGCFFPPMDCSGEAPCVVYDCVGGDCQITGPASNGTPCDDGDACTESATCNDLQMCTDSSPVACDDEDPCTSDSCDSETGCVFDPIPDCP